MASDQARDLRQQGITAAKAGQKDEARRLLQQAIRLEPDNEAGWLWLASVARDGQERLFCLQKILEINPHNDTARKALQSFESLPATPPPSMIKRLPNAPDTKPKVATQELMRAQVPGVPMPTSDRIAEAQKSLDALIRRSLEPLPNTIKWTHKTRARAGERDIIIYRLYVFAGILVVLVVLGILGGYAVSTNEDLRALVLAPTATATNTPTPSLTPTYGLTPTPSSTPRLTWTPTDEPPNSLPTPNAYALPRVTPVYPPILERPLADAYQLILRGDITRALPTLEAERRASFDGRFDANPYYYEALARILQGRYNEALDLLTEAEDRLEERPDEPSFRALVDTGFAQAYWALAERALDSGNPAGAQQPLEDLQIRAEAAIDRDPRIVAPYLVLAESYARRGSEGDALEVLNRALVRDELDTNTDLIMAKAQLLYQTGDTEEALYQAFLARYVDPTTDAAYRLQIQIATERGQHGQAVLYAQDYLFYYPGKTEAHRLLAEAHLAEGSEELALQAFTKGLSGNTDDQDTILMLRERANLYMTRHQYDLAVEDYSRLMEMGSDTDDEIGYIQAAYFDGQTTEARTAAESLVATGNGTVNLILGRILIDTTREGETSTMQRAVTYLNQANNALTSPEDRATAQEYLAHAQLNLRNTGVALDSINNAITLQDTARRRYLRAQILLARNERDAALADYEWVLAWSQVFPFTFRDDIVEAEFAGLRGS